MSADNLRPTAPPRGGPVYQVSASTDIGAPPEAVWELLCDPHRYPELVDQVQRMVHVADAPMGEGSTYTEYGGVGPFQGESEWTVTEFRPKARQVHEGDDGTVRLHLEIDLEPTPAGCRLTQRLGLEPRGAAKIGISVLWPLFLRRAARHSVALTVANLREAATRTVPRSP